MDLLAEDEPRRAALVTFVKDYASGALKHLTDLSTRASAAEFVKFASMIHLPSHADWDVWPEGLGAEGHDCGHDCEIEGDDVAVDDDLGVDEDDLGVDEDDLGVDEDDLGVDEDDLGVDEADLGVDEDDLGVDEDDLGVDEADLDIGEDAMDIDEDDLVVDDEQGRPSDPGSLVRSSGVRLYDPASPPWPTAPLSDDFNPPEQDPPNPLQVLAAAATAAPYQPEPVAGPSSQLDDSEHGGNNGMGLTGPDDVWTSNAAAGNGVGHGVVSGNPPHNDAALPLFREEDLNDLISRIRLDADSLTRVMPTWTQLLSRAELGQATSANGIERTTASNVQDRPQSGKSPEAEFQHVEDVNARSRSSSAQAVESQHIEYAPAHSDSPAANATSDEDLDMDDVRADLNMSRDECWWAALNGHTTSPEAELNHIALYLAYIDYMTSRGYHCMLESAALMAVDMRRKRGKRALRRQVVRHLQGAQILQSSSLKRSVTMETL
ncbi:Alpha-(1,3)-fucosyltransferase FucT [Colletotrichum sidae]|uniref:Alpha-(1,3)-fucosyltransferase FucT n=1 Tax=Colletotrichum sidae TaxID=1347389 RepID=A0A4R8TKA5_9PEZI|nr:Alpha-(1,3)-fucosyltransferase FucT [Colletotrichum sidae]